tara:strand:+ start:5253 stop:6461 length:1209 start_codon:yes stop_codon:yes gene_type:complete
MNKEPQQFPLATWADVAQTKDDDFSEDWIIPKWLPARGVTQLAAGYGKGKSWVCLWLAQTLTRPDKDLDFLGIKPEKHGSVLHFDMESGSSRRFNQNKGECFPKSPHPHYFACDQQYFPNLTSRHWESSISNIVDQIETSTGSKPVLIIIENLGRLFPDNDLQGKQVRSVQQLHSLAVAMKIPILIAHHLTKGKTDKRANKSDDYSGDGVIGQCFDSLIEMTPGHNKTFVLSHKKSRHGPSQPSISFELELRNSDEQSYLVPVTRLPQREVNRKPKTATKDAPKAMDLLLIEACNMILRKKDKWEHIQKLVTSTNKPQTWQRLTSKHPGVFAKQQRRLSTNTTICLTDDWKQHFPEHLIQSVTMPPHSSHPKLPTTNMTPEDKQQEEDRLSEEAFENELAKN